MVAKETRNKKQETEKIEKYDPSKIELKWQEKWKEAEFINLKRSKKRKILSSWSSFHIPRETYILATGFRLLPQMSMQESIK